MILRPARGDTIILFFNIGRPILKQNSRKMLSTFAPSNENKYKNDKIHYGT